MTKTKTKPAAPGLFNSTAEWGVVGSVIGSGFEDDIARLAIEDGIAKRAARKNMQIHSAVVLKVAGEFAGFMTFQCNHTIRPPVDLVAAPPYSRLTISTCLC